MKPMESSRRCSVWRGRTHRGGPEKCSRRTKVHTASISGILTATRPCSVGTCQEPPTLPGGAVPGTTVQVRQSDPQGAKVGSARTPACSLGTTEMEDTHGLFRGNRGRAGGQFHFQHRGPQPSAAQVGKGAVFHPAAGGTCRCDRRAPMTHPPPHLAVHLLHLLLAQVWPRRGASSPRTLGPQILPWKGERKITPSKAGSSIHRTVASRQSVFGSHHGHGFNPVIPWHLLGPR